jgi:superfamily II DNA helicase RecQ
MALTKQKKTPLSRSPSQQRGRAGSEGEEATGGILLEKEDIRLIYKALRGYTPTDKEEQLYGILVETFEELLATEYTELQLGEE